MGKKWSFWSDVYKIAKIHAGDNKIIGMCPGQVGVLGKLEGAAV